MKTKKVEFKELSPNEAKKVNGGSLTEDIWYGIGLIFGALSQAGASPRERANYYM